MLLNQNIDTFDNSGDVLEGMYIINRTEILLKLYAVDGKYFFSHIRQTSLAESSDAADRD